MFKILQSATALSLILTAVESSPHVKSMHGTDSVDVVNTGKKMVKEVKGFWGLEYMKSNLENPTAEDRDFRVEVGLDADVGLGFEGLMFWI